MYFDDPYDPNLENDYDDAEVVPSKSHYDDDASSESDRRTHHPNKERFDNFDDDESSTTSTAHLARRRIIDKAKLSDPGYFTVKRFSPTKYNKYTGKPTPVTVGYYHTPTITGLTIRNAVSGLYETGRLVGSKEQDLFFKVGLCTGENGPDTHFLFYDSPSQCERHLFSQISDVIKDKWNLKSNAMRLVCAKAETAANDGKYKRVNNMIEVK